ncbi:PASTA domain-containing protein [Sorangium sp. So ce426]|uniref:PASTA domain-containing protein n=1 Tax=Sorangium sp. So ce426 TaxID=3133312 RepID=UPI003F5BE61D
MKITARVITADGAPLASAKVDMVAPGHVERDLEVPARVLASGVVRQGALSLSTPDLVPPVWALTIDGQPVLAFPAKADEQSANLGEIVMQPNGLAWNAFHAKEGRVFGAPGALLRETAAKPPANTEVTPPLIDRGTTVPPLTTAVDFSKPVPLSVLFGSTAQQLSSVATASRDFKLTGATLTVRGLPAGSGEDLGLQFPDAELAKNGNGLSELSFALRPELSGVIVPTKPPPGPALPDLSGYTRELAVRKLAAAGLTATIASEVVADPRAVGRVVRQTPKAGTPADPDARVQLFIGKAAEGS